MKCVITYPQEYINMKLRCEFYNFLALVILLSSSPIEHSKFTLQSLC